MINKTYAIAFVAACAVGVAFGTSPMAGEAVHCCMTYMDDCAKHANGKEKCTPPQHGGSRHVVGSVQGHPEMKQAQPQKAPASQDHAINTKGTGSTRTNQSSPH
jgi:hypothetical protein